MQSNRPKAVYAGFFARLSAFLIDSLIVGLLTFVVSFPISAFCNVLPGELGSRSILFQYTLKDILLYLAGAGYFVFLTYMTGKTIGKRALNLRVINADGTLKLSLINVIFRETVGRFLCSVTFGIGYLLAGIDSEKRGLHDRICDTRVIYEKEIVVKYIRKEVKGRPESENERELSPEMRHGGYSYAENAAAPAVPEAQGEDGRNTGLEQTDFREAEDVKNEPQTESENKNLQDIEKEM